MITTIISSDTKRTERIQHGQYETKKWPVLHAGNIPKVDTDNWRFNIFGLTLDHSKLTIA